MADAREKPSFVGLPTELRLKIYDYVIHADIDCVILKDILHTTGSNGTQAVLVPVPKQNLLCHIPWLNLLLTCNRVAWEMRSHMAESSFLNEEKNRTCVLDLDVYHDSESSKPNRHVTWRSLPCSPSDAQVLVMNVTGRGCPGPWTEGGAASLARALYQLLNHLLHKGPRIVTGHILPEHMVLRELILNINIGENTQQPALGCNTIADYNYRLFVGGWEQISKTGFLSGYLENTKLRGIGEDVSEKDIGVQWQKVPAIPGYWRGYGFQWVRI